MTKTNQDTTRKGPVNELEEYYTDGIRDDMVRAGLDTRGTVGLAQVHLMVEKIQEQKHQLTDKKRETSIDREQLVAQRKVIDKTKAKLTAANAVVEAVEAYRVARRLACTHGHPAAAFADGCSCFDCDTLHDKAWAVVSKALDERRKLQGGDGE